MDFTHHHLKVINYCIKAGEKENRVSVEKFCENIEAIQPQGEAIQFITWKNEGRRVQYMEVLWRVQSICTPGSLGRQ